MLFYKSSGQWKKNTLSVLEPPAKKEKQVPLKEISVFLCPGRAFDRQGGRLGRGKGYYDRTLAPFAQKYEKGKKTSTSGFRNPFPKRKQLFIGIAFVEQVHNEKLAVQEHDVFLDMLVTDRFVLTPLPFRSRFPFKEERVKGKIKSPHLRKDKNHE